MVPAAPDGPDAPRTMPRSLRRHQLFVGGAVSQVEQCGAVLHISSQEFVTSLARQDHFYLLTR